MRGRWRLAVQEGRGLALCAVLSALALGPAPGCDSAVADQRIEITAADLPPSAGAATGPWGGWQSVGWQGDPWPAYPGSATLIMHHDLGWTPTTVLTYLSFEESGAGAGLAAGDMARVVEVTDSTVTVRNDTQADFFVRMVLMQ